jgi:hypothetical protein
MIYMMIRRLMKTNAATLLLVAGAAMAQTGKVLETGTFHGAAHQCSGRATVYETKEGKILRLTHFSTSNGPKLHVVLIAASDAQDDENFLDKKVERVDLGAIKGNQGDQNYPIPVGTDLSKFKTVSIFCERFNANFGAAPLQK